MITDAQEAALAARRAQTAQDKRNPFLIHVDDGRLMPNVARLRGHAKYRVFTGSPKATPEERMAWLRSMGNGTPLPTEDPFDIGTASVAELIAFAASEYGVTLDPSTHHNKMRAELRRLAAEAGNLA
ncbi:MAG TPA: hypothetical protein PKV97_18360 [Thauera aminoaromatica]|jgi:hypothetical protein|nr:hypothetical protein [Pseudomonadota bacterium]HNB07905.1 hypothetical protein [Thauera aminoaromatica]